MVHWIDGKEYPFTPEELKEREKEEQNHHSISVPPVTINDRVTDLELILADIIGGEFNDFEAENHGPSR